MDPKIVKAFSFGAGCLLGLRSCLHKRLPTYTALHFLNEIITHVDELFLAHGFVVDFDQFLTISELQLPRQQKNLLCFLKHIAWVYAKQRNLMLPMWDYFATRPITYDNFLAFENRDAILALLYACAECINFFEQIFGSNGALSDACADFLQGARDHEIFQLLKPIIKLRLHGCQIVDVPTPAMLGEQQMSPPKFVL